MGKAESRILIVAHHESSFPELFELARFLKNSGRYAPVFLFDERCFPRKLVGRDAQRLRDAGIEVCGAAEAATAETGSTSGGWRSGARQLLGRLPWKLGEKIKSAILFSFPCQLWLNVKTLKRCRALIAGGRFDLLILGLDLAHYNTACYVKAAHEAGIRALIVSDMMPTAAEFGELYFHNRLYRLDRASFYVLSRLFPRWVMKYNGRRLKRLPSLGAILAKECAGVSVPDPWQMHSGYADAILVESERVRRNALGNGLPEDRVIATGTLCQDRLASAMRDPRMRQELCRRLGFTGGKPLLLLAMPQDDQPKGRSRPFPTYQAMVEFLVRTLAACPGFDTVVCLHPSHSLKEMRFIEKWGARIADAPTASVIPLCDIFVATFSSTIKWAISCAKPVVVYDYNVQSRRRAEFAENKGVFFVDRNDDFASIVNRLTADKQFFAAAKAAQETHSAEWGRLDGASGGRILRVIDSFVSGGGGGRRE